MVELLPFRASAKLNQMVALDPAQVFAEVVVFSVPQTAAGILGVHIDRLHARSNALAQNAERCVPPIRLSETLRAWYDRGREGCPLPPVTQIVKRGLAGQLRRDLARQGRHQSPGSQWPA